MSRSLDMSLDEIISKNKSSKERRGRASSSGSVLGPGPDRRLPTREPPRAPYPYILRPAMQVMEPLMMIPTGGEGEEAGTKLYISNLDYGVSNDDIKVLFSEVGEMKRYSIHYDRSGRSKGTAEVVFVKQADALAAIERYNNINLDGKPMKIEVVGLGVNLFPPNLIPNPIPPAAARASNKGNPNGIFRSGQQSTGTAAHSHGSASTNGRGGGRGFARGQGQRSRPGEKVTAEQLDAELEKYHLEAIKIN